MAHKTRELETYKGFSLRLKTVSMDRGMAGPEDIASAIYKNIECREMVHIRNGRKKNCVNSKEISNKSDSDALFNEKSKILRLVQKHMDEEDPCKIPSAYMQAYSIIFNCSLDYLYCKTDVMSSDLSVADICDKTGLSEKAVNNLISARSTEKENNTNTISFPKWWSELLQDNIFFMFLPLKWKEYSDEFEKFYEKLKQIEINDDLKEKLPLNNPIDEFILHEDGYKTDYMELKELDHSYRYKQFDIFSYIEDFINKHTEEWILEKSKESLEKYTKLETKKRKALIESNENI